jgi:hypothetical protein
MVLSRSKRSNAGKAPPRLDDATASTPPPSAQPKASRIAVAKGRSVSVVSQGSNRAQKLTLSALKRAKSASRTQSVQPASLRRPEDVSTASPSPPLSISSDDGLEPLSEGTPAQEDKEDSVEVEAASYSVEWRVLLGKRAVYNTHVSSTKLDFEQWSSDAQQRAEVAAAKLKKGAECLHTAQYLFYIDIQ